MERAIRELVELSQFGIFGLIGGIASYFYGIEKRKAAFKFTSFITKCLVAYMAGMLSGDFLSGTEHGIAIAMVSGIICYPIIGALEEKAPAIIKKWMG